MKYLGWFAGTVLSISIVLLVDDVGFCAAFGLGISLSAFGIILGHIAENS